MALAVLLALMAYSTYRYRESGRAFEVSLVRLPNQIVFRNGDIFSFSDLIFLPSAPGQIETYFKNHANAYAVVFETDPARKTIYLYRIHCPPELSDTDCMIDVRQVLLDRGWASSL